MGGCGGVGFSILLHTQDCSIFKRSNLEISEKNYFGGIRNFVDILNWATLGSFMR